MILLVVYACFYGVAALIVSPSCGVILWCDFGYFIFCSFSDTDLQRVLARRHSSFERHCAAHRHRPKCLLFCRDKKPLP